MPVRAVSSATASRGKIPIPVTVTGRRIDSSESGDVHAHGEVLADLEAGGIGQDGVDEHLVGPIRVREPAGLEGRELEGELVAGGRDHATGERRVGLLDEGEEAALVAVPGDRRLGVEDRGRLLGREVVGHDGGLGVRRVEDAAVGRGGVAGGGEAGQREAERQAQHHAATEERREPPAQAVGDEVGDQRHHLARAVGGGAPAHRASVLHPAMMAQPAPTTAAGGASTTTARRTSTLAGVAELRVRLLGGLVVEGRPAREVGSRKARTLLAALAVAQGAPVGVDVLAEVLWADDLPAKPSEQVGVLVSRLRGSLGADRIPRHDAGYALVADWLDLQELDEGVAAAERAVAAGDALVGPAGRHDGARPRARAAACPRRARRGSTARGRRSSGRSPPPACWPPRRRSCRATRRAPSALAARGSRPRSLRRGGAALADARARRRSADRRRRWPPTPRCATRLAEDLGVSPAAETEALHSEILRAGPEPAPVGRRPPAAPERWDPLVQRARAELAATDFDAARRDAERGGASRRRRQRAGGGRAGSRTTTATSRARCASPRRPLARRGDDERRTSALTLSGRARHSRGDLAGAERDLEAAAQSTVAGVRGTGEVWLGNLRMHQGRFEEAIDLSARGAVDAAALRHPFVIPHAMWARIYALGALGSRRPRRSTRWRHST